jgi:hypothetical protein
MVNPRLITSDNSGYHIVSFIMVAMEREVTVWFRQQPKEFYAAGFQELVKQWDKCLNVDGNKSIFQISTLVCLSSVSICNLLIELPS